TAAISCTSARCATASRVRSTNDRTSAARRRTRSGFCGGVSLMVCWCPLGCARNIRADHHTIHREFPRMRVRYVLLAAVTTALVTAPTTAASQQIPAAGTGTVVLRAARVIDGTGSAPIANGVVVVTDD